MALACLVLFAWLGPAGTVPDQPVTGADHELQEEIEQLVSHPVDINSATLEQLLAIPWLSPVLAQRIIAARKARGRFASIGDLAQIPGMSPELLDGLAPVLTVRKAARDGHGDVLIRAGADSALGDGTQWAGLARVRVAGGQWQAFALTDKDAGERSVFDCTAFGAGWESRHVRVLAGDYAFGAGQGLVFSAPHRLAGDWAGPTGAWQSYASEVSYAPEPLRLRGFSAQYDAGSWTGAALGSFVGRDARLNPDGSAQRLVMNGTHDDSVACACRNTVEEATAGALAACRWSRGVVALTGGMTRFSRVFAPGDSTAFAGRSIAAASVATRVQFGSYALAAEVAGSGSRGMAAALRLDGAWPGLGVSLTATGRRGRYFAPHGRWPGMSFRSDRLDFSGQLRYRPGWFEAGATGGTFYDYETDSIPGRAQLWSAVHLGQVDIGIRAGRRFKADASTSRTADCEVEYRPARPARVRLVIADEYPEEKPGRGRMVALSGEWEHRALLFAMSAERFDIAGPGISMSAAEPGPMRTGASYSTSTSCWRAAGAASLDFGAGTRIGLRAGCTWRPQPVFDLAAQIEAGTE